MVVENERMPSLNRRVEQVVRGEPVDGNNGHFLKQQSFCFGECAESLRGRSACFGLGEQFFKGRMAPSCAIVTVVFNP